jgi:hypothetical protein
MARYLAKHRDKFTFILRFTKYYQRDQIKEDEKGGA